MSEQGWKRLLSNADWFCGEGRYPIAAYSEFMPPPRVGWRPYGLVDPLLFADDDPWGWHVTEYEELFELAPGLAHLNDCLLKVLRHLGRREPAHGVAKNKLSDNPYWPAELQAAGAPAQERYVILLPLALSRTQDDKGRVRWTCFGNSEQGPARGFWRGFFTAPDQELPREPALDFFRRLLAEAYGEPPEKLADLRRAGFRILPGADDEQFPFWSEEPLPSWTAELLWEPGRSLSGVKYLLTFQPFARLPASVRKAYLAGELRLLPFPGSLFFWGAPPYRKLQQELPFAVQIPLLHAVERREAPGGLRVPQSGWLHEPRAGVEADRGDLPVRNTFKRTHRWARVHRHDDELAMTEYEDKIAHVLFSTEPDDVGLYGKPMARNAQIWTRDHALLLDGPRAAAHELAEASRRLAQGGLFGYRFQYPAMRVNRHEVYWHRPLVGWWSAEQDRPGLHPRAPLGYLTAYDAEQPRLEQAIELWPRLFDRSAHRAAAEIFDRDHDHRYRRTTINIRKLLDTHRLFGHKPLEPSFARQLLTLPKEESLDAWLASLPARTPNVPAGRLLADSLRGCVAADRGPLRKSARRPKSLTFDRTARRSFEEAYWKTIAELATGRYVNKDNADCVQDEATKARLHHHRRDLEALGDHLLEYYRRLIARKAMLRRAVAGELPFQWRTDFAFDWSGGWVDNQEQNTYERDLLVVIPGRDRRRAVIMADHYDTAYMEDVYGYGHGGGGPRLAAAGADDNHSATAALMLAAPIFLDLSRRGQLACDIWLVHLTGEEFPSDCMGARYLCQCLVEGSLKLRLPSGKRHDLSRTRVEGVYVMDMIAHNNDRDRDVFQICPGVGEQAMWLAYQAHVANRTWNSLAPSWNEKPPRRGLGHGRRSADPAVVPEIALHPHLHGEIRPYYDPRSTLYNTDGQIFSDAGVPVVLFMENYDINRRGYHDTHDTMENIDLDYGAALAAITIETVARAATEQPPGNSR